MEPTWFLCSIGLRQLLHYTSELYQHCFHQCVIVNSLFLWRNEGWHCILLMSLTLKHEFCHKWSSSQWCRWWHYLINHATPLTLFPNPRLDPNALPKTPWELFSHLHSFLKISMCKNRSHDLLLQTCSSFRILELSQQLSHLPSWAYQGSPLTPLCL